MAVELKRSDHNPFRTPPVTPDSTGAGPSNRITTPLLTSPQPQPNTTASEENPRLGRRTYNESSSSPSDSLAAELQATTLEDTPSDPPPAYTPSANPYQGEATVELGPRRPFQPAPHVPPVSHQLTGASQVGYYLSPQATGLPVQHNPTGAWSQYPGQPMHSNIPQQPYLTPPPQQPFQQVHMQTTGNSNISHAADSPLSEFAMDFYASGSIPQHGRSSSPTISESSSIGSQRPEHFERVHPAQGTNSHPPPGSRNSSSPYTPPSGPPPSSSSQYSPPSGPPPVHPSRIPSNADDWRPTNSPTPGRPLLNKGRVLIYPPKYECKKCLNTGYKNFDPSHPCKRCWEKYSKPYTGAITCAPRSEHSQRPLPNFRPPHMRHSHSQSQPPSPSPSGRPPNTRPNSDYRPGLVSENTIRPPCTDIWPRPNYPAAPLFPSMPQPQPFCSRPLIPRVSISRGVPPPGATIVNPGDQRIGGRLCWRCGGSGTISFLIFDVEKCPACNGIGRVFN